MAQVTSMLRDDSIFISTKATPPIGKPTLDETSRYQLSNQSLKRRHVLTLKPKRRFTLVGKENEFCSLVSRHHSGVALESL